MEKETIVGDSPVDETEQTPVYLPSNAGHEKSCVNLAGPSAKAKYLLVTDSEPVP